MTPLTSINNSVYETLGERWYDAKDDPVALLRAEARVKNPWVADRLRKELGEGARRVLDVGCGGGFLSNFLAAQGWRVTGVDLSETSLRIARERDSTGRVEYLAADAYRLPFSAGAFDAICAMDFLEHVEDPARAVAEAARVLRPGGLFFFHTFNRNPLSRLVVIRALEWFVRNTPEHLHLYSLFIRPDELVRYCATAGLETREQVGIRPVFLSRAMWRLLRHGIVEEDFGFRLTSSLAVAYLGYAVKRSPDFG